MDDVERMAMTRVRKGGKDADRVTGNHGLAGGRASREPGPTKEDGMPDWDRHLHFIVANATWDDAEKAMEGAQGPRHFHAAQVLLAIASTCGMSAGLAELGYEIETKLKPGRRGGMEYHTWDIKAAPGMRRDGHSANDKNSRRHQEIEDKEQEIVAGDEGARSRCAGRSCRPSRSDKLSATTRLGKRQGHDARRPARLLGFAPDRRREGRRSTPPSTRAKLGLNPNAGAAGGGGDGLCHRHHFQRSSVVDFHDLAGHRHGESHGRGQAGGFRTGKPGGRACCSTAAR